MNPIALISFTTRIGPWLGRTIGTNAGLLSTLVARLKVGGQFAGNAVGDIVKWVKLNPGNATLLATTLASMGFTVSELFGDSKDPDVMKFSSDLNNVAAKASALINSIGASKEAAKFGSDSEERRVQDEVAIEVLSWARGFFGGVAQAVDAHRMMQAFVEMPLSEVQHGFAVYKLR